MASGVRTDRQQLAVAIVGAGRFATYLAVALRNSGYRITEIIARNTPQSRRHARVLAAKVGAKATTSGSAALDCALVWFCVPDREILSAAEAIADRLSELRRGNSSMSKDSGSQPDRRRASIRFGIHSSGALSSRELTPLGKHRIALASAHPLMTFVANSNPSLEGVPFALEGDANAVRTARSLTKTLGAQSFEITPSRKPAYHAWATMTSPLLLAFLVTLEDAARSAGFSKGDARRKSLPIIRQTVANYAKLGPAASFSGPLVRGDAAIVAKHLSAFRKNPGVRQVYRSLANAALRGLPVTNRNQLRRLLAK
jgi:predicted short-subunit dehydrogenase-like oxidoreductase (DUF2520 family)